MRLYQSKIPTAIPAQFLGWEYYTITESPCLKWMWIKRFFRRRRRRRSNWSQWTSFDCRLLRWWPFAVLRHVVILANFNCGRILKELISRKTVLIISVSQRQESGIFQDSTPRASRVPSCQLFLGSILPVVLFSMLQFYLMESNPIWEIPYLSFLERSSDCVHEHIATEIKLVSYFSFVIMWFGMAAGT